MFMNWFWIFTTKYLLRAHRRTSSAWNGRQCRTCVRNWAPLQHSNLWISGRSTKLGALLKQCCSRSDDYLLYSSMMTCQKCGVKKCSFVELYAMQGHFVSTSVIQTVLLSLRCAIVGRHSWMVYWTACWVVTFVLHFGFTGDEGGLLIICIFVCCLVGTAVRWRSCPRICTGCLLIKEKIVCLWV